jgi:hypothetical protein
VPDSRRHRGRHPADTELFAAENLPELRVALYELSWILGRGYSANSALELVGDRYQLRQRQRRALLRSACSDAEREARARTRQQVDGLAGADLAIDGFNCIITTEAALASGAVIIGRDGAHRDMASVHGSYRKVAETQRAVELIGEVLTAAKIRSAAWYLDRPVSNSGRLRALITELASERGWPWTVELANSPDHEVIADDSRVTASCDGWILDRASAWIDVPGAVIAAHVPDAWLVDLRGGDPA